LATKEATTFPFQIVTPGKADDWAGVEHTIVVELKDGDDGMVCLDLPQFDFDVCVEDREDRLEWANEALREMLTRLLAFYAALTDLPPDYINEVEEAQVRIIERVLLPWMAHALGRNPGYITLPADTNLDVDKLLTPA
jgi:hypothetical protein